MDDLLKDNTTKLQGIFNSYTLEEEIKQTHYVVRVVYNNNSFQHFATVVTF